MLDVALSLIAFVMVVGLLSEIYGKSENGMVNSLNTRVHELEIVLDEICCYVTFI